MDEDILDDFCCIIAAIVVYNNARDRYRLTRTALLAPTQSPWTHLLNNGNEASFLTLTGFDHNAFRTLVDILFTYEERTNFMNHPGRKWSLNCEGQLGLAIMYLNSKMYIKHLCTIFGVVPSTADRIIKRLLNKICTTLIHHPAAKIKFPDDEEKVRLAALIEQREPLVKDVIGFIDGLALMCQCSSDDDAQASFYNGYHHNTTVNNVLFFSPEGKIIYASINFPGSWHDSTVATHMISHIISDIGNYKAVVDQGFPRHGDVYDILVGPLSHASLNAMDPHIRTASIRLSEAYISLRQSSEWGMRALQGSFCRLKSHLPSNMHFRRNIICAIIHLHNFRTEYVGLNQIATVFNPQYDQLININGYDRIRRYYNHLYVQ